MQQSCILNGIWSSFKLTISIYASNDSKWLILSGYTASSHLAQNLTEKKNQGESRQQIKLEMRKID